MILVKISWFVQQNMNNYYESISEINQIQIRNFEYRLPEEVDAELSPTDAIEITGVQVGVIAQELVEILPKMVNQESTGVYGVDTDNLTWHLVNAVQELSAEVEELKSKLDE